MTEVAEAKPWDRYLEDSDRAVISRARFGLRMGFGERPAVVAIDCQRYMVGERGVKDDRYPSSCGEVGWAAIDRIAAILHAARARARSRVPYPLRARQEWRRHRRLRPQADAAAAPGLVPRRYRRGAASPRGRAERRRYRLHQEKAERVLRYAAAKLPHRSRGRHRDRRRGRDQQLRTRNRVRTRPPTIFERSCRVTRFSTACPSRTRSAFSIWTDSTPT